MYWELCWKYGAKCADVRYEVVLDEVRVFLII